MLAFRRTVARFLPSRPPCRERPSLGSGGQGESGQALIEFIILIPIVLMFLWYLVHVNLAINKSIVGQKAARSQLFLKLFNHRSGPMLAEFRQTARSHFYIGVSSQVMQVSGTPEAPVEVLGIGPSPRRNRNANDDPGEPAGNSLRQRVRVRTVFGICTHRKRAPDGGLSDFCATEHTGRGGGPGAGGGGRGGPGGGGGNPGGGGAPRPPPPPPPRPPPPPPPQGIGTKFWCAPNNLFGCCNFWNSPDGSTGAGANFSKFPCAGTWKVTRSVACGPTEYTCLP